MHKYVLRGALGTGQCAVSGCGEQSTHHIDLGVHAGDELLTTLVCADHRPVYTGLFFHHTTPDCDMPGVLWTPRGCSL